MKLSETIGSTAKIAVDKTKNGVEFIKNNTPSSEEIGTGIGVATRVTVDTTKEVGKMIKENAPKVIDVAKNITKSTQKEAKSFWSGIKKGYNATK